jgi:hypothetical protein
LLLRALPRLVHRVQGGGRIDAEDEVADQRQHHAADADPADPDGAQASAILDVSGLAPAFPTHRTLRGLAALPITPQPA